MRVLVIGASRGIGLATVKACLADGHQVRAFARSADRVRVPEDNLQTLKGDALDPPDVARALEGVDVVVQSLGVGTRDLAWPVTLFSDATRILVTEMERCGVKRLISVTGFGAGASRRSIGCLSYLPFRLVLGRAYDDKDVQERLIEQSQLDWTIVRPGILTPGPETRRYKVLVDPSQWRNGLISREDVASFIVSQLSDMKYVRHAPVLIQG